MTGVAPVVVMVGVVVAGLFTYQENMYILIIESFEKMTPPLAMASIGKCGNILRGTLTWDSGYQRNQCKQAVKSAEFTYY